MLAVARLFRKMMSLKTCLEMFNWESDLVEKRVNVVKQAEGDPLGNLELIALEMRNWEIWLEKGILTENQRES
jgi:hypothetical protein